MTKIKLSTNDQVLTATVKPPVSSGSRNAVEIEVAFDEKWSGYSRTAIFYTSKDSTVYERTLSGGTTCKIPQEVLREACTLYIALRGVKSNGEIKTSARIAYDIVPGSPIIITSPPSEDIYNQILTAYGNMTGVVHNVDSTLQVYNEGDYTDCDDLPVGSFATAFSTALNRPPFSTSTSTIITLGIGSHRTQLAVATGVDSIAIRRYYSDATGWSQWCEMRAVKTTTIKATDITLTTGNTGVNYATLGTFTELGLPANSEIMSLTLRNWSMASGIITPYCTADQKIGIMSGVSGTVGAVDILVTYR